MEERRKDKLDRMRHGWGERLLHVTLGPGNYINWFKKDEDDTEEN